MNLFMAILSILVIFTVGYDVGKKVTSKSWRINADEPRRILSKGEFYKVTRLGDAKSESFTKLHRRT